MSGLSNPSFPREPVICNTCLYRAKSFSGLVYHVIAACVVYSFSRDKMSHLKVTVWGEEATQRSQQCASLLQLPVLLSLTVTAILHCDLHRGHNMDAVVLHSFLVSVSGKNKGKE